MGMVIDLIKSLSDMHELAKLQDSIQAEIEELDKEGKLPAELKTAFETLKSSSGSKGDGSVESSVEPLEQFAAVLEKYENLFPDNIKKAVDKFESVTKDLEGIAGNVDKLTKK